MNGIQKKNFYFHFVITRPSQLNSLPPAHNIKLNMKTTKRAIHKDITIYSLKYNIFVFTFIINCFSKYRATDKKIHPKVKNKKKHQQKYQETKCKSKYMKLTHKIQSFFLQ